ncbi:putative prenylcysteine lyase [Aspergillus clavatus NRRL 1]|uniref:Prenylcysteine lyase, putative n=1 Tax=Aspergillus clavatus (strain ATCC 1007 / CBS 513.65 / DSM 816 / NCTC 3887 / NRRL 1 / QM 1276 / 107) TaxID=344612 RepID=A1CK44_ASPCL|nr:prenylcysteine lyase, putative [Aspergillus clavatus NRRL 1]EAW09518.1 prenylcysteine lyase, putative [Aspergillus clavatus NRRL 1]
MDTFPQSLRYLLVRFCAVYCAITLCLVTVGSAEQQLLGVSKDAPKRVAIVGAGAAGSSSAYSLRKYADSLQIPVDITVFERAPHVGGRSTTVDVLDDPRYPVELGASIFVSVNYELVNASRDLGLTVQSANHARPRESDDTLGVWDGEQFVLVIQDTYSWWTIAKLIWRYGLAPIRTQSLMKSTVSKFLRLYEKPLFPFRSLTSAAAAVDLLNATASTGAAFLQNGGISADFARDIIQASTRVNYGQNLPLLHGLEAMVCMATDGAVSIAGGNWRIFDGMLKAAQADVRINQTVTSIRRSEEDGDGGTLAVTFQPDGAGADTDASTSVFDEVIIAGPLQYSGISITPPPEHTPDEIPYVKLHVTLFTSPHRISPQFFNLAPGARAPETILTTLPRSVDLGPRKAGVGPAGFWSISTLRTVDVPRADGASETHYVYKVFSPERLTADFLERILGLERATPPNATIGALPKRDLSWYREKVWNPYPFLFPRVTFEDTVLAPNVWYTGGIESFISTMETSALMGRNVAALISQSWENEISRGRGGVAHEEL